MKVILFEDKFVRHLYPLTLTRPASYLRIGIQVIYEKWQRLTQSEVKHLILNYLAEKFNEVREKDFEETAVYVNSRLVPDPLFFEELAKLPEGTAWKKNDTLVAYKGKIDSPFGKGDFFSEEFLPATTRFTEIKSGLLLRRPYDIFRYNKECIEIDFVDIVKRKHKQGIKSAGISDPFTKVYNNGAIFIEEGAKIRASIINPKGGFIYIGKDAEISEGSVILGNHAICRNAVVQPRAILRGDSTLGIFYKVGGEVSNSVFIGYSNKSHDGFLGNSVIGEWCNLGANTTVSNLKNNYSKVRVYDYPLGRYEQTALQFCGAIIGDHTKLGIQTMLNTATVIGVSANVFGSGFPPKFIPSFAWGGADFGWREMILIKAFETAEAMMARRNKVLSQCDKNILEHIFHLDMERRKKLLAKK